MATQEAVKQTLEAIPEAQSLIKIVNEAAREVKLDPVHLVRVAATAIRLNPKLAKCTPASFVGALIVLEQVGLEPVAGRAYLLPFLNNRKVGPGPNDWHKQYEVQALIGYKGYSDLFYRHESALSAESRTVHKNDMFEYEYGTQSLLRHKPAKGDRGPTTDYYAIAKMKDGAVLFLVMSKEECIEHGKKHSKVYNKKDGKFMPGTPWVDDEDSMCKKTVFLQLTKNLPLSIETQKALSIDETSRDYRPGIDNALDLPVTTNWDEEPIEVIPEPAPETKLSQVEKAQPAPNGHPEEEIKSPLPKNILDSIDRAKNRIGEEKFMKILGSMGCSKIEEISTIQEANTLISAVAKEASK